VVVALDLDAGPDAERYRCLPDWPGVVHQDHTTLLDLEALAGLDRNHGHPAERRDVRAAGLLLLADHLPVVHVEREVLGEEDGPDGQVVLALSVKREGRRGLTRRQVPHSLVAVVERVVTELASLARAVVAVLYQDLAPVRVPLWLARVRDRACRPPVPSAVGHMEDAGVSPGAWVARDGPPLLVHLVVAVLGYVALAGEQPRGSAGPPTCR
jgi:hypothetical protein